MRAEFETVLAALLDHVNDKTETKFKTVSRRLLPWGLVEDQPALFMRQTGLSDKDSGDGLPYYEIDVEFWVYVKSTPDSDDALAPGIDLNKVVADFRRCFYPDASQSGRFTLNGLVYDCRIEGKTEYAPGDIIDQSIAVIPVQITVTDNPEFYT